MGGIFWVQKSTPLILWCFRAAFLREHKYVHGQARLAVTLAIGAYFLFVPNSAFVPSGGSGESRHTIVFSVPVAAQEALPVADAGPGRTGATGATTRLDGSASTTISGKALSYAWTLPSAPLGSTASMVASAGLAPRLTPDIVGDYVIELIVSAGNKSSGPDTVTISTENSRPVADPGADRRVDVGQTVTLDASGSLDDDGDALGQAWSLVSAPAGSTAALSDPTALRPTLGIDLAGDYVVELVSKTPRRRALRRRSSSRPSTWRRAPTPAGPRRRWSATV